MNKVLAEIVFLICMFTINVLIAQNVVVKGVVYKHDSDEPVEFANVYVKGSTFGTITDINGKFVLRIPANTKLLHISAIGYITTKIPVKGNTQELVIYMNEDVISIDEIVVSLGRNPALDMHDSIIKYKDLNDPDKVEDYKAQVYKKETYLFTGLDTSILDNVFFRKHPEAFLKLNTTDSLVSLPIYLSERISKQYRQSNPYKQREEIVAEQKDGVNFITGPEITSVIGTIQSNFYRSHLFILDKDIYSPLAVGAKAAYNYYLQDTNVVDGDTLYKIKYKPRIKRELLLQGYFWYNSRTHGVVDVYATIPNKTNINFLKGFSIRKTYDYVDSSYFWGEESINLDFIYTIKLDTAARTQSIRFIRKTAYTDVALDNITDEEFVEQKKDYQLIQDDDAFFKDTIFWNENRPIEADTIDVLTKQALDNVNDIGLVKVGDWLADMLLNGWIKSGPIEIGPWESLFKSNELEGFRFTFGARLAPKFSKRYLISGFVAYGSKDHKWKYGGSLGYTLPSSKYQIVQGKVEDNVITVGNYKNWISYIRENLFVRTEDNIFGNLIKRRENYNLYHLFETELLYLKEWRPGITTRLMYNYFKHNSSYLVPFTKDNGLTYINSIENHEITFHLRLTKDEIVSNDYFKRTYFLTKYPRLHIVNTYGNYIIKGKTADYYHLRFVVEHYYPIWLGKFAYIIEAGHIFGKVPFLLLEIPRGNDTYGYNRFDFNLMNVMEYANDTYANLHFQYATNGFILNRIPLIRALKLRESFTAKILFGNTRKEHETVMDMPASTSYLNGTYAEVGFGITNLFKVIRLHNSWRLTGGDKPGVSRYILQIGVLVEL